MRRLFSLTTGVILGACIGVAAMRRLGSLRRALPLGRLSERGWRGRSDGQQGVGLDEFRTRTIRHARETETELRQRFEVPPLEPLLEAAEGTRRQH